MDKANRIEEIKRAMAGDLEAAKRYLRLGNTKDARIALDQLHGWRRELEALTKA